MRAWLAVVAGVVVASAVVHPAGARAIEPPPTEILLVPGEGSRVEFGDGSYAGTLTIVARPGGLGLIEEQTVNGYLAGIREVPFSWPDETLRAQAIAARTYLAWTLQRGRSRTGADYGYDICASTQCQVYRGRGVVDGPDGGRWMDALVSTESLILVYDGAPAQALYSASHGPESRGVEEIWGGDGLPYLVRVASPEEGVSPFDSWTVEMPTEIFAQVLRSGGVLVGPDVSDVAVVAAAGSVSVLRIESTAGVTTLPLTTVRAIFNIHGPARYPGLFPTDRNDGRRLPQSVPSYSFTAELIGRETPPMDLLAPGERPEAGLVRFMGAGWGHGVGLSQWGAYAMGSNGADAGSILAHYYGGLAPEPAGDLLPDTVAVGLAAGRPDFEFEVIGEVAFVVPGRPSAVLTEGRWRAERHAGGVVLFAVGHDGVIRPQGRLLR
jgi:stage II sporulation protein D